MTDDSSYDTNHVQRRLLDYLKPHKGILTCGLLCAALVSGIEAGLALFIKWTVGSMRTGNLHELNLLCLAIVLIFVVKGLFSFGQNYLLALTANTVATQIRDQIFASLHRLSLSFFNRRRTGAIMSILMNDVPVIQNSAMGLKEYISAPLTIVISLAGLFWFNWVLTLLALIFIPFMAVAISRIGKRIRRIAGMVQGKLSDVTSIIEETVAGIRIVKSFAAEEHEINRFKNENARTLDTVMRGIRKSAQLRPMTEIIGAFGIALVLFVGGNMVAHTNRIRDDKITQFETAHRDHPVPIPEELKNYSPTQAMTEEKLIAFMFLLDNVARAAGNIGGLVTARAQALAAARRIFEEVLDVDPEVKERPDPIDLPVIEGHVRFENVSFCYNSDDPDVLKNMSFDVMPGEVVALVGRSGAGKSTLVDLIPRFYDPTEGRILIDGIDIRDVKLNTLRQQIGIVPQETWLFAGTLRDNIAYGKRTATDEEIKHAAYSANASFIEGMEQKLDTVVGDRGIRLSGGEKQRIAIARAILMNPRLLILDEATSSLDASSEALVQEALDQLMRGRTTFVIAHRLSTIINADRILAIQDGQIVEMGSHRELIEAGGYYARLYETQLRGYE